VVIYSFADVAIGKDVVISQKSYLCAEPRYRSQDFAIQASPIVMKMSMVAADVFVAPRHGGKGAVVGSRSSVSRASRL